MESSSPMQFQFTVVDPPPETPVFSINLQPPIHNNATNAINDHRGESNPLSCSPTSDAGGGSQASFGGGAGIRPVFFLSATDQNDHDVQSQQNTAASGFAANDSVSSQTNHFSLGALPPGLLLSSSIANSRRESFNVPFNCPMGVIVPGEVYVGSFKDASSEEHVAELNIKAFLCVAREVTNPLPSFVSSEDVAAGKIGFKHLPLADDATTTLADHIPEVFGFIDEQRALGRPVVLYCQQGKSRSVAFAVAYLMRELRLDLEQALMALRCTYTKAEPNIFFLSQLDALSQRASPRRNSL